MFIEPGYLSKIIVRVKSVISNRSERERSGTEIKYLPTGPMGERGELSSCLLGCWVFCVRCQMFGVECVVFDVWCWVFGVWGLGSGAPKPQEGKTKPPLGLPWAFSP